MSKDVLTILYNRYEKKMEVVRQLGRRVAEYNLQMEKDALIAARSYAQGLKLAIDLLESEMNSKKQRTLFDQFSEEND